MILNRKHLLGIMLFGLAITLFTVSSLVGQQPAPPQPPAQQGQAQPSAAAKPAEQIAETTPDFVPGSWSMVLLPDTQMYAQDYPGLFTMQTHWIARNKDKFNIRYVLHLGDITNGSRKYEWERAREAMGELDGAVPYAFVPGNHDYHALADRRTRLNEYFPLSNYKEWPTFGGAMNDDMCNSYHLFSAGEADWIVLALEWAPRDEVVDWANEILAKHADRAAIVLTHAYLYADGTRYNFAEKEKAQAASPKAYPSNASANDGEDLWNKLVRKNNVALVVCGHIGDGRGFLTSVNDGGKKTHQMLVDYQSRELGGEGFLRILEFHPDGKTVQVKSYSPLYDAYMRDSGSQFTFELDK
ncbi:MAG: metallophosphoesterase [Pirellulaceae bacterium]|nr:metallophosphoesterase [Pirellulaceae bacterium]